MPKRKQEAQPTEKWLLQYEEDICGERRIVESHLYSSKKEAVLGIQPFMDSRDAVTVSLKRVHMDQEEKFLCEQNAPLKAYHANPSSQQLGNSIDIDAIELEDIDLDEILLDESMMNEMQGKIDWQEVCCTFLKNIMTPKKKEGLVVDFPKQGSPITNLSLRRAES